MGIMFLVTKKEGLNRRRTHGIPFDKWMGWPPTERSVDGFHSPRAILSNPSSQQLAQRRISGRQGPFFFSSSGRFVSSTFALVDSVNS